MQFATSSSFTTICGETLTEDGLVVAADGFGDTTVKSLFASPPQDKWTPDLIQVAIPCEMKQLDLRTQT